jgi:hypothetical protein
MLTDSLLRYGVVINNVVVCLLQHLPRRRNWLHKSFFSDPHQLLVNRVAGVHSQEPCILFDFLLQWRVASVIGLFFVELFVKEFFWLLATDDVAAFLLLFHI